MSELINSTFNNRYQILSLLGQGGMGSVYRAQDLRLHRDIALKVMHSHYAANQEFRERFMQEATTAARFSHPGIIPVYDAGQSEERLLYIVMELIPGENLNQMLRRLRQKQQWVPLRESVELIRQVARALDYAHREAAIHRDIKPANIMIKPEPLEFLPYRPVIADFGLAKLHEGGVETQTGVAMGTPAYMSPEQTLGEEDIDARTDIYSLGVVFYELVAGQPPFQAKTLTQALRAHTREQPPAPSLFCPGLPPEIERVILKALEKEPQDRYATGAAMAAALDDVRSLTATESVPLTAISGASGLLTQLQESILELRGQSIVPEPHENQVAELLIRTPDGKEQRVALKHKRMKVGRNDDNQIMLNDEMASRYHAQIEFDGVNVWVTDLASTNGTFLGKEQLTKNQRYLWDGKQPLRIGDHHLFLQLVQAPQQSAPPPVQPRRERRPDNSPPIRDEEPPPQSSKPNVPSLPPASRKQGMLLPVLLLAAFSLLAGVGWWLLRPVPNGLPSNQVVSTPAVQPTEIPVAATVTETATAMQTVDSTATVLWNSTATSEASQNQNAANAATATTEAGAVATTVAATVAALQSTQTAVAEQTVAVEATSVALSTQLANTDATRLAVIAIETQNAGATATAVMQQQVRKIATETAIALEKERQASAKATAEAASKATADAVAIQQARNAEATAQAAQAIAAAQAALPTNTPKPPPPPTPIPIPGLVTGFENFGQWARGSEPWGNFTASRDTAAGGAISGKLDYDFSSATRDDDYVVFVAKPSLPIQGQPKGLKAQVYGDGSRNFLIAWIRDSSGTIWQFAFGRINHTGWGEMSAPFDLSLPWPNSKIDGSGTSVVYPVSLYALVLNAEDHAVLKGTVYVDELFGTDTPGRPSLGGGGAPPASTETVTVADNTANISCGADPQVITAGQHTTVFWQITNVRAVYFGNEGVGGVDKRVVTPNQTTTFTLKIIQKDGSETSCSVTVQVN